MKTKLMIYGTGQFAEKFMQECIDRNKAEVVVFAESKKSKDRFMNADVISVCEGGGKLIIMCMI